jgi:Uri superfamily endonuclease
VHCDSGWYAYAGSAQGRGGIGARLARHFRKEKKPHWHIDRLTILADAMFALAMQGTTECEIVARLNRTGRFATPQLGFGSSDCRQCEAHLLKFTELASASA